MIWRRILSTGLKTIRVSGRGRVETQDTELKTINISQVGGGGRGGLVLNTRLRVTHMSQGEDPEYRTKHISYVVKGARTPTTELKNILESLGKDPGH